ncbi:hypothetical protein LN449_15720 [Xanthomonas cannabis]|uniref:hypothetical protein n=1 Tax=Xanthomonas cannabis TaxID=1885674 RepID=UPI001E2A8B05|nr:hypothetical protein [Xanthomonas cannabis]MCC8443957.1 hypothetical protein [Xanthomonas cannabis]
MPNKIAARCMSASCAPRTGVAAMSALPLRLTIRLHTARGDHKKTPRWRGLS